MSKSKNKNDNERVTIRLNKEQLESLKKLGVKNNTDVSKEIRTAIQSYLNVELIQDNIELITDLISNEINVQHKKLGNRLGGMYNRTNIVTGTMYYLLIAVLNDLIPQDRYTDFEEIQERAKKYGLQYANSKSDLGLEMFLNNEETKKAVSKILTGDVN